MQWIISNYRSFPTRDTTTKEETSQDSRRDAPWRPRASCGSPSIREREGRNREGKPSFTTANIKAADTPPWEKSKCCRKWAVSMPSFSNILIIKVNCDWVIPHWTNSFKEWVYHAKRSFVHFASQKMAVAFVWVAICLCFLLYSFFFTISSHFILFLFGLPALRLKNPNTIQMEVDVLK